MENISYNFNGKVALITGSSSGIGAETAICFSKFGASVVVTGRNASNVADIGLQCDHVSPNASKALQVVADLSQDSDCERLIKSTIEKFGKIDILVNNAGVGVIGSIRDANAMSAYEAVMNVNVRSVVYITHLAVKHLELTKGVIINISSCLAFKPRPQMFSYCMSKSALDMFTKCLAIELGPKGIRVNSVNPSLVRSNFDNAMGLSDDDIEAKREARAKSYPLGRIGEPKDVANAILFLSSNNASFITGTILVTDGGFLQS